MVPAWLQEEIHAATEGRGRVEWIQGAHRPYFGLKVQWPLGDPRWEYVRSGQMSDRNAFDLEQMFPEDCSPNDMASYVRSRWGDRARVADPAKEAARMVDAAQAHQDSVRERNVEQVIAESTDRYAHETPHSRKVRAGAESAHPMVSGGLSR
jgi:hypothetical protein